VLARRRRKGGGKAPAGKAGGKAGKAGKRDE